MEKTMIVAVHKATIELLEGESINDFTRNVSAAGRECIEEGLSLGEKSSVYPIEVMPGKAVFEVYNGGAPSVDSTCYYSVDYQRGSDGEIECSNVTPVRRVVSFEPVETEGGEMEGETAKAETSENTRFEGWEVIEEASEKSLWGGIL